MHTKFIFALIVFSPIFNWLVIAEFEFTNIECKSLDKPFADFEYCYIKAVNRSYKYISAKIKLFQVPITNVSIQYNFMRRENGYKPFLYKGLVDACKYLKSPKNIVVKYFYGLFRDYSNMNHTCPYEHDLILDKLDIGFLEHQMTNVLPVPKGQYALFLVWNAYNVPRADVRVYVTLS